MIFPDEVEVKWHGGTREHYENLGYVYTKKDQTFIVKATELTEGSNVKVRYRCDYCGHVGKKRNDVIKSQRQEIKKDCCNNCARKKHNEVKIKNQGSLKMKYPNIAKEWCTESNEQTPDQLTPYSRKKVVWKCEEGHKWKSAIYSRTNQNTGCPFCSESEGEKTITKILREAKIPFIQEVSFSDLEGRNRSLLRYDFAVLDHKGIIKAIIEYDGPFHFGEVYPGDNHKRTMELDLVKDKYCEDFNIPLYRIPYHKHSELLEEVHKILEQEGLTQYKQSEKEAQ